MGKLILNLALLAIGLGVVVALLSPYIPNLNSLTTICIVVAVALWYLNLRRRDRPTRPPDRRSRE